MLNFYDLLSTPEYESVSKLFLKQMLYRIVSVRQILDRPASGTASSIDSGSSGSTSKTWMACYRTR